MRQSIGWTITLSILMIVAGILCILLPPVAGVAAALTVGWLLILGGAAHLVFAWHMRSDRGWIWQLLLGLLYLAVGIFVLTRPVLSLVSLTLMLAAYLFAKCIVEIVLAFQIRPLPGSGWLIFDGVVALILSLMIWWTWPASSEWAIGTLIGISILFGGFSRLSFALAVRRLPTEVL